MYRNGNAMTWYRVTCITVIYTMCSFDQLVELPHSLGKGHANNNSYHKHKGDDIPHEVNLIWEKIPKYMPWLIHLLQLYMTIKQLFLQLTNCFGINLKEKNEGSQDNCCYECWCSSKSTTCARVYVCICECGCVCMCTCVPMCVYVDM